MADEYDVAALAADFDMFKELVFPKPEMGDEDYMVLLMLWNVMFDPDNTAMLVARSEKLMWMLQRIAMRYLDAMPKEIKPTLFVTARERITFGFPDAATDKQRSPQSHVLFRCQELHTVEYCTENVGCRYMHMYQADTLDPVFLQGLQSNKLD